MKPLFILMCFIGFLTCIHGADAGWKFSNLTTDGFKDFSGKHLAVFKGVKNTKNLLVDGLYGKAVRFEGGRYQLKVNNSAVISLKNNFTIACVFKPQKINSYRTLLWKGNRKLKPQQINYYLDFKDGKPEFKFKNSDGKWISIGSRKPLIESEKWYYLVVTMDKKGMITGYLNGIQCFKQLYKPGALVTNSQPAYIGAGESYYGGGIGYPFNGLIDRVTISSGVTPPSADKITEFKRLVKLDEEKSDSTKKLQRQKYIKIISASPLHKDKLSEMTMAELKSLAASAKYHSFFAKNANDKKMIVSVLPTASRILRVNDYSSGKFKLTNKAVISAARNEYEGFQLILLGNPESEVKDVKISLSELKSTSGKIIPTDKIEWGFIRSIKTTKPVYDVDYVGYYPDPIMEGQQENVTVPQNGFAPVYVRVHVDNDVAAGNYKGKIKVGSQLIDVNLKVYDFTLPVTSSCKVIFSFFEGNYSKWYEKGKLSDKEKMYIYDFLLKYRVTPNNIYSRGIYPELKFLPELKKKGANFCTLGYLKRNSPVSQEELKKIISDYKQKINLLKNAGFEKEAYLYAFDEVAGHKKAEKDAAKQIMSAVKKEFPDLKTIQTSSPYPELLDYFKVWVPSFSYLVGNEKQIKELAAKRKTLWWYCADTPLVPYPNFFMDYPVFNNRIIFTLSYKYNIDGVLYWCINREWSTNLDIKGEWPEKAWKPYIINIFNKKRMFKNGMGNYVYPGKDGRILPSLRLENLRDGVEDYEYLVLLKKLAASSKDKNLVKLAEKLLQVPADVAVAVNQYSSNPENLMNYRNKIASIIEKLKKK
jgi:Glycoside hydrolase 123, catalytic domain/Concanavalin A-like lectin/glucanases superfamily/Glycoside hydrolase 123 N-terminal domain